MGLIRRVVFVMAAVATAALVLLAALASTGRMRVVPVDGRGSDVPIPHGALAVDEPIAMITLAPGDLVLARPRVGSSPMVLRVDAIDSFAKTISSRDDGGRPLTLHLAAKVWRVRSTVPHGGTAFDLLVGPVQAVLLVVAGMGLIFDGERIRRRHHGDGAPALRRRSRRSSAAEPMPVR